MEMKTGEFLSTAGRPMSEVLGLVSGGTSGSNASGIKTYPLTKSEQEDLLNAIDDISSSIDNPALVDVMKDLVRDGTVRKGNIKAHGEISKSRGYHYIILNSRDLKKDPKFSAAVLAKETIHYMALTTHPRLKDVVPNATEYARTDWYSMGELAWNVMFRTMASVRTPYMVTVFSNFYGYRPLDGQVESAAACGWRVVDKGGNMNINLFGGRL